MKKFLAYSFAIILITNTAHASSTGAIGSPKVKAGETSAEVRFGYTEADENSSEDERFRSRVHIDHGFNDLYALRVVAAQDKRKNNNYEYEGTSIENRFYLLKAKDYGFDFGVRAIYNHKDGDKKPNSLALGFYEMGEIGAYEWRMNQTFDHEVGEDAGDGIGADLRFQIMHPLAGPHKIGAESFHDLGNLSEQSGYDNQSHTIGPVVKGTIFENYKYETGYRTGVSEAAPDNTFKFFVSRSF